MWQSSRLQALALLWLLPAWPAMAICVDDGSLWLVEVEVSSCQVAGPRLEEVLAAEPPMPVTLNEGEPDFVVGRTDAEHAAAAARLARRKQEVEFETAERAKKLRAEAATVVIVKGRMTRQRFVDRDPTRDPVLPRGDWKRPFSEEEQEFVVLLEPADCAAMPAGKVVLADASPCCDVIPSWDLACCFKLRQTRLAPPELIED